jgi:DNA-binding NarL/FixJ family response regulator
MNIVAIESIPLLLHAICQAIESKSKYKIGYCAVDLHDLEATLQKIQPDLLWLDTAIPEVREGSAFRIIHRKYPDLKILLFGIGETLPEIRKYFKQGISAYLPKTAGVEEIEAAIVCLSEGELYISSTISKAFNNWLTDPVRKKKPGDKLTQREHEVLQLIVDEFTTIEIAKKLFISQCTVETHRINLIQKMGVKNVAGLVREAIQRQLYSS